MWCCLLIRRSCRTSVSCLWELCLGPDAEPVQGRTGDPAPPAPLSSRVSLIQCSNFSLILNNYCNAATFACRPQLFPLHLAGPLHRSVNRLSLQRIPKHTPLILEYSNINSYLAGIKIGYAIASIGVRTQNIQQSCALATVNALVRQKYYVFTVSCCQICSYCVCKRTYNS